MPKHLMKTTKGTTKGYNDKSNKPSCSPWQHQTKNKGVVHQQSVASRYHLSPGIYHHIFWR